MSFHEQKKPKKTDAEKKAEKAEYDRIKRGLERRKDWTDAEIAAEEAQLAAQILELTAPWTDTPAGFMGRSLSEGARH